MACMAIGTLGEVFDLNEEAKRLGYYLREREGKDRCRHNALIELMNGCSQKLSHVDGTFVTQFSDAGVATSVDTILLATHGDISPDPHYKIRIIVRFR